MPPWITRLAWLAVLAALLHAGGVLWSSWDAPLLDAHAFRQTQTALTAYWLLQGGPFLAYETPVVGAPWAIPFELPLYQAMAAALALVGIPLDAAGRLLSFAFLVATVFPLRMLRRDLDLAPVALPFACALILAAPLYTFWGRAFLIETCAWFFGWLWLALFVRLIRSLDAPLMGATAFIGLIAATTKATTFPAFVLLGGFAALPSLLRSLREGGLLGAARLACLLAIPVLLPLGGALAWVAFTDAVKEANPIGRLMTSQSLAEWNHGSWAQRFGAHLWTVLLPDRILPELFGFAVALPLMLLALAFLRRRDACAMLGCVSAFLAPLLVFSNLHVVHNYYQVANGAFLIVGVAVALASLAASGRMPAVAASLMVVLLGAQIAFFGMVHRRILASDPLAAPEYVVALATREIVPPQGSLVVLGAEWSSTVAYYAQRRSLTLPSWTPAGVLEALLRDPQSGLGDAPFAGIVDCTQGAPGYGDGQPAVDRFVEGRAVLLQAGRCRLLDVPP